MKKFKEPLMACLGGERTTEKPRKVYLLGDSHANQFVDIIEDILAPTTCQLQFINAESHKQGVSGLISKPDFIPEDFAFMLENAKPDDVFILSFHRGRLNKDRDIHVALGEEISVNDNSRNFTSNLMMILSQLKERGVKKLLIYDTPMMAYEITAQSCVVQTKLGGENLCRVSKAQDLHTRKRQEMAYSEFKKNIPDIVFWDLINTVYGKNTHHDILDDEGDYLMRDMNHISNKLAKRLKPGLQTAIEKLISK